MTRLSEENIDDVIVIRILGNLTIDALATVEARFDALAGSADLCVVADMSAVEAITTPAITLMLRTARSVERNGGKMVFAGLIPGLRQIFTCCRLDTVLTFVDDLELAIQTARLHEPSDRFGWTRPL